MSADAGRVAANEMRNQTDLRHLDIESFERHLQIVALREGLRDDEYDLFHDGRRRRKHRIDGAQRTAIFRDKWQWTNRHNRCCAKCALAFLPSLFTPTYSSTRSPNGGSACVYLRAVFRGWRATPTVDVDIFARASFHPRLSWLTSCVRPERIQACRSFITVTEESADRRTSEYHALVIVLSLRRWRQSQCKCRLPAVFVVCDCRR